MAGRSSASSGSVRTRCRLCTSGTPRCTSRPRVRPGPPGVHGGGVGLAANWEEPICRTCYDRAVHTHGPCPTCTTERLLPGRRSDGQPICRDCAGITRSFICAGCGTEAALLGRRRCERCTLTDKLTTLLDDGTGRIRRELQPLHAGLSAVDSAQMENLLSWVAQPKINTLLTGLARGTIVISHEALARDPTRAPPIRCGNC